MSTRKEKIPIVRFRAFSEPWFQNQLSEVAEFSKGRGYSKKAIQPQGTPIILYGRLYTKYESVISNIDTYANMEKNSVISEGGEVIIPASGESAAEISRASCVTDGGVILGGDINIVKPHENLDPSFIAITLSNGSQQRELSKRAQGKSVVHLHNSDLKAVKLFYPSYEEQSAIGSLFRTLDDLLASYKDNLANYQSLKVTMLSKMFPKAGETVPKIRLDGFEGEWECVKMADIFQIIDGDRGKSYPGESDFSSFGHTLFLDTRNVKKTGLDFSTTKFISEEKDKELRNGKLISGDFVLTSRGTLGNVAYYDENIQKRYSSVRINSAMLILRPLLGDKIDPEYILAVLRGNLISNFMKVNQVGSAQPHITKKEFSKIKVLVPSNIQEQQAIGSYFSNLDNLINSYQEKISQLEILKKKLLQDMFI